MTRARALLSLSLITSGAMLGGLGLGGYYEPGTAQNQPVAVPISASIPAAARSGFAPQGRLRFVAVADDKAGEKSAASGAKPKPPAKTAPPANKPKAEAKERSGPRPKQHVAAPWPWNIFGE